MDDNQLPQTATVDEERARRRQESMNAIMQAAEIATENISKIIASRILESGINHQVRADYDMNLKLITLDRRGH